MRSCEKYHREAGHGGWDCPVCKAQSIHALGLAWRKTVQRDLLWNLMNAFPQKERHHAKLDRRTTSNL